MRWLIKPVRRNLRFAPADNWCNLLNAYRNQMQQFKQKVMIFYHPYTEKNSVN